MTVSRYSLGITLVGEVGVQTDSKELIHFPKSKLQGGENGMGERSIATRLCGPWGRVQKKIHESSCRFTQLYKLLGFNSTCLSFIVDENNFLLQFSNFNNNQKACHFLKQLNVKSHFKRLTMPLASKKADRTPPFLPVSRQGPTAPLETARAVSDEVGHALDSAPVIHSWCLGKRKGSVFLKT